MAPVDAAPVATNGSRREGAAPPLPQEPASRKRKADAEAGAIVPAQPARPERPEDDASFPFVDLVKVGQGTYGSVYRATRRPGMRRAHQGAPGERVALKRLLHHDDDWGFSITSLRERHILQMLKHDNLVRLYEVYATSARSPDVYFVFEFLELDLEIIIQSPAVRALDGPRVKSLMQQLLEGVHYMHKNQIMHRDLKPSNLLVGVRGDLKVCDFGLARSYKPGAAYTNPVITLNYRPPEVLLGCRHYGLWIDMWSVGTIFGELLTRKLCILGRDDASYLENVWQLCGTPVDDDWRDAKRLCPKWTDASRAPRRRTLQDRFATQHAAAAPLLDKLLQLNPTKRAKAVEALDDKYFWEGDEPLPKGDRALPWDANTVRAARDDHQRRLRCGH
ncbi:kinase-like domain-containing protein [Pelagophyceae sp. CCMP2097]|nr:kinase-like domain-containing protein [Pelagophyceae sp. CCMP2097]